LIEEFNSLKHQ